MNGQRCIMDVVIVVTFMMCSTVCIIALLRINFSLQSAFFLSRSTNWLIKFIYSQWLLSSFITIYWISYAFKILKIYISINIIFLLHSEYILSSLCTSWCWLWRLATKCTWKHVFTATCQKRSKQSIQWILEIFVVWVRFLFRRENRKFLCDNFNIIFSLAGMSMAYMTIQQ